MPADSSNALCTNCGRELPKDRLTPVADALVCDSCRPDYLENLRRNSPGGRGLLFGAVDPDGNKVTDYVEAPNLGAARYTLEMRGYTDIVFYEDDVSLATSKLFGDQSDQPLMDGDEFLNLSRSDSELYAFWVYLRNNAFLNVLMLAVLVAALLRGNLTHWSAIVAYIYFALMLGFYVFASVPVRRYNRLLEAVEWGRWDEVEKLVQKARKKNRFVLAKVPEFELDVRQAQVLAARGEIEAALELLNKYENDPTVEPFLYHSRRSAVFSTGNDYDSFLAETRKAAELAPTSGSMQVDLAMAYVTANRDAESAQAHLDKARALELPDIATLWLHMVQGIIHLENGKPDLASGELDQAAEYVESFAGLPFVTSVEYTVMTYQALTAAALGDMSEARILYSLTRPWLEASGEIKLLERGDAEIGSV